MSKLFHHFDEAIEDVVRYNGENHDLIAINTGGVAIWQDGQQWIFFTVCKIKRVPATTVLELFLETINMPANCVQLIRDILADWEKNGIDWEVVSISEWTMIVKINTHSPSLLADAIRDCTVLNRALAQHMSDVYGRMPSIQCQPSKLHKKHHLLKIGVH